MYQVCLPVVTDKQNGFLDWYVVSLSCMESIMSGACRHGSGLDKNCRCERSDCSL